MAKQRTNKEFQELILAQLTKMNSRITTIEKNVTSLSKQLAENTAPWEKYKPEGVWNDTLVDIRLPKGVITLPWEQVKSGYCNYNDEINNELDAASARMMNEGVDCEKEQERVYAEIENRPAESYEYNAIRISRSKNANLESKLNKTMKMVQDIREQLHHAE